MLFPLCQVLKPRYEVSSSVIICEFLSFFCMRHIAFSRVILLSGRPKFLINVLPAAQCWPSSMIEKPIVSAFFRLFLQK